MKKRGKRAFFSTLAGILASALIVVSCAKDRSLDDYKQEQVQLELSKIQSVSGTYRGTMTAEDGTPLGPIEVALEADTQVSNNSDNYKVDEQAVLNGRVTYGETRVASIAFTNGLFSSTTKNFRAKLTTNGIGILAPASGQGGGMPPVMGTMTDIILYGTADGMHIKGGIKSQQYPESGGKFSLTRDAKPEHGGFAELETVDSKNLVEVFETDTRFTSGEVQHVELLLIHNTKTLEEQFFNLFLPFRRVQATLLLSAGDAAQPIPFADSQIDIRTGAVLGRSQPNSVSSGIPTTFDLSLYCNPHTPKGAERGYACKYISNTIGEVFTNAQFKPKYAATGARAVRFSK
jgi:hypothetical protein